MVRRESRTSSEGAIRHNSYTKLSRSSDEAFRNDLLRHGTVLHLTSYNFLANSWYRLCAAEVIDATLAQSKILDLAALDVWAELLENN